ncbi:MAG: Yip1 family protein [Ardenticatenia bacterium]|nr:Yip1 family protein [Ardenticatenia bacterium]
MVERMIRAARLEIEVFEEVEANPALTQEAITVVVVIAVLNTIGSIIASLFGPTTVMAAIVGGVWSLIGFFIWAWLTYFIGTQFFGGTADYGELIRTLGYAYTPNILGAFSFIPCLGALAALVGAIWALVAMVVAVRQALDFDTVKAILTVVVGFIVYLIGAMIVAVIFGVGAAIVGG